MPIHYQAFEDYNNQRERLNIQTATKNLTCPTLIIHGEKDETIPLTFGKELSSYNHDIKLYIIKNATHSFGGYHPYIKSKLPKHTIEAVNISIDFLKEIIKTNFLSF